MKQVKLKPKIIKSRITLLKAMPYEGHMVYIRLIGVDLFEWLLVYQNEIYSSSMVFTPTEGKKELTPDQINVATNILWAGAESTIDTLMGKVLDKESENLAKMIN